ncbi:MAG: hypothetical protein Q9163_006307 [Psora crenata]
MEDVMGMGGVVCLDEKSLPVARLEVSHWSVKKEGKLQLVGDGVTEDGMAMDETVMVGLAMLEQKRRRNCSGGGGVGS